MQKWRRRFFVLYAPPVTAGESMSQETVSAMLEYYTNQKMHSKCGSIDLANCEEVYSALDSDMYDHVFCIRVSTLGIMGINPFATWAITATA